MDKFCVNCKYHVPAMLTLCVHPNLGVSPVTGKAKPLLANTSRFNYTGCGPDGNWYSQIVEVKPVKWWNKLLGWKN